MLQEDKEELALNQENGVDIEQKTFGAGSTRAFKVEHVASFIGTQM